MSHSRRISSHHQKGLNQGIKRIDSFLSKKRRPRPKKGYLLFFSLIPLFMMVMATLIQKNIPLFLQASLTTVFFFLTAKINQLGLKKEHDYLISKLTKAPRLPLKMVSSFLLASSTFYASFMLGKETWETSLFLGLVAMLGYFLFYGFDPHSDKLTELGDVSADFLIKSLQEAKKKLQEIESNISQIQDISLHQQFRKATDKAYEILHSIEENPETLRISRKFMVVYLNGLKKLTNSYTQMRENKITAGSKNELSLLLTDVEEKFDKELIRLQKNQQFNLDVNIDVLKEEIKQ